MQKRMPGVARHRGSRVERRWTPERRTYTLRAQYGSAAPERSVAIEVRPGETTRAEVRLVAARSVLFDFQVPEGEHPPRQVRLEVHDSAGSLAFVQEDGKARSSDGREFLRRFEKGRGCGESGRSAAVWRS